MASTAFIVPSALHSEDGKDYHGSQVELHNTDLLSGIQECAEVLDGLLKETVATMETLQKRWRSAFDNSSAKIRMLTHEFINPHPVGYTEDKLVADLKLKYSAERLRQYYTTADVPSVDSERRIFDQLYASALRLKQKQDVELRLAPIIRTVLPVDDFGLLSTLLTMNDFQHADPLAPMKAEFSRSLHEMSTLESQVAQVHGEREAALRVEDMKGAEDRGGLMLSLYRKILDTAIARTERTEVADDDVANYHENMKGFLSSTRLEEAEKHTGAVKADADADIEVLDSKLDTMSKVNEEMSKKYEKECKEFYTDITQNLQEQCQIWEKISALMVDLDALRGQRTELIREQVDRVEKEQLRKREHTEISEITAERRDNTVGLRNTAQAALKLLEFSDDYVRRAVAYVEGRDIDGQLKQHQLEEYLRYYDVYKRYVLFGGELVFRQDRRLENTKRMIRSCEFQIAHAMEALDTELPQYREQRQLFIAAADIIAESISSIRAALREEEVSRWKRIEGILEGLEVHIDPPSYLLNEMQVEWMKDHVQAVDDFANEEQKIVDVEKNAVRKMQNACVATKSSIEARRSSPKR